LSRPDLKFTAASEAAMDAAELLAALGAQGTGGRESRRTAIARYLAAAPDWREARDSLGGAFADSGGSEGLKGRKAP
jgi:hypothetical protein